jgi:hypothetical protein
LPIMTSAVVSGCIGPSTAVPAQCGPALLLVSEGLLHESACDHLLPVEQWFKRTGQQLSVPVAPRPRPGPDLRFAG